MSGQLLVRPADAPDEPHLRVRLRFADGGPRAALRRPAHVRRHAARRPRRRPPIGPASTMPAADRAHRPRPARPGLRRRGVRRAGCGAATPAVKRALLDQTLISGVGNIYADEALWRARLHGAAAGRGADPAGRSASCSATCATCWARRCAAGGTSFDALYVNVNGRAATSTARWPSTGGRASRARAAARRSGAAAFMNRSSFFCPYCQRRRGRAEDLRPSAS